MEAHEGGSVKPTLTLDPINPPHYIRGGHELIELQRTTSTEEEFLGYTLLNAWKYLFRYKYKGKPVQDLKKAIKCIEFAIEVLEKREGN